MASKLIGWDDTIVALATPPGVGAIGVIRISGKKSFEIIDQLFPSKKISEQASHTLHVGYLKDEEKILDEVVISLFHNPKSYTGENVIEISCHGSSFVQQQIIQAILNKGARLAKPGEFTQRAFLNGKLDLTQAESVADLIASNTEASLKTALQNMRGGFSNELKILREKTLQFSALIELELDFSQEDIEFADRKKFYELITEATQSTNQLINSFTLGNVIKNGVQVSIIGKPNSGKSTLLNILLNEDRAIVSEIAGTTRDTIEEVINIDGILFRLIDTAGIRDHSTDIIENIGIERSLAKIQLADIVIYLFDTMDDKDFILAKKKELEDQNKTFLLVVNKKDLLSDDVLKQKFSDIDNIIFISAKENKNIDDLKKHLVEAVLRDKIRIGNTVITNARHYDALQKVSHSLQEIKKGLDEKLPGDLIASDIRQCLHYLGEITGEITTEDQLDYIFSKFCIGK
ncbi:MAG TPA: tRNA uridine-5-carboxymethylaminomethyl(34) synthesis GTPase MnmE [Puia sp.]|jgi:tRNA modification GTPase|nr:tRNA uridine-5-carboxymethylaminomethyl(34) synthesis GTPase MnmE [Puia sp.]